MSVYDKQDRGDLSEYEAYFAGMDASMQQKIALTTAHFPTSGRVADMGSGSGSGTFDLARLYRHLTLVGVDINPVTVEYSNTHYDAENLSFAVGDIADRVFPDASLDGILDSSVLHHVTSFNGFEKTQITRTLRNQVAQLKPGGVLIIRDFVVPDDAEKSVVIGLSVTDGFEHGDIPELSTAALFEVFARDFRSSLNLTDGVAYEIVREDNSRRYFKCTLRSAAEFVLRKDYRDHWAPELLEEYTYFSQSEFESAFRAENLRIVVSMPLWNPWIVENRFAGKFSLADLNGESLVFPPTNYLIVGEKVDAGAGVVLTERSSGKTSAPSFLKLKAYRHKTTGQVFELAERPHRTIDLLPWFEGENGQLFVVAKKDFPRPVVNADAARPNLNRANYSGYVTEPIAGIADLGLRIQDLQDFAKRLLWERASISADQIVDVSSPDYYYTSPGGVDERVEAFLVRLKPFDRAPHVIENYTKFASAGTVRELDALQVLRASHVGGMFDARLEINIYRLLRQLKRSASAWIGASVTPVLQEFATVAETHLETSVSAAFEESTLDAPRFLELRRSEFDEFDAAGNQLANAEFEYVVPRALSKNTVAAIPFIKTEQGVFVGVEVRDLPAPQRFTGNSQLICTPAWRLPEAIGHKFDLDAFLRNRFPRDFGAEIRRTWELGGSYFTSAGVTPEVVYPFAAELDAETLAESSLTFYELGFLLASTDDLHDAHLLIALNRLGHALGSI